MQFLFAGSPPAWDHLRALTLISSDLKIHIHTSQKQATRTETSKFLQIQATRPDTTQNSNQIYRTAPYIILTPLPSPSRVFCCRGSNLQANSQHSRLPQGQRGSCFLTKTPCGGFPKLKGQTAWKPHLSPHPLEKENLTLKASNGGVFVSCSPAPHGGRRMIFLIYILKYKQICSNRTLCWLSEADPRAEESSHKHNWEAHFWKLFLDHPAKKGTLTTSHLLSKGKL